MVLPKTCGFMVQVRVKHTAGTGFVGTGVGWTSPTHAVPVCHPSHPSLLPHAISPVPSCYCHLLHALTCTVPLSHITSHLHCLTPTPTFSLHPHPYIGLCMGMGKPMGFAAWVQQVVWVQCLICQPAPTLHPSWVTCRFQPLVPTLAHMSGCVLHHLSCTSNLKVSYSLSLPCLPS